MKSVLILIAVFFIVRALKKSLEGRSAQKAAPAPPPPAKEASSAPRQKAEEMALDPVCGSYVPLSAAVISTEHGKTVYFCSDDCREKYEP